MGQADASRWIGGLLLLQFAAVCLIKCARGIGEDIGWLSHVALLMTAVGLVFRRRLLVSAAFVCVLVPHTVWLADFAGWLLTGTFPMQIAGYLADGDIWTWLATLHHFYLLPLLLMLFVRDRWFPQEAFPLSVAVFVYLSLVSRIALPPGSNVNYAFSVELGVANPLALWMNDLPEYAYLLALNGMMTALAFLPAAVLLRRWSVKSA